MRRMSLVLVVWLLGLVGIRGGQDISPPQVSFRSGVDIVQLDVSVLDARRRPVRGLTAADFTILENGTPTPVVAFSAVDLDTESAVAETTPPSFDVVSNIVTQGRLVVIMIGRAIGYGWAAVNTRRVASEIVESLGPTDLAAVVYTDNGTPQNFTADRSRLLAAVNSPAIGMTLPADVYCPCNRCALEAITRVAESVSEVPQRRKTLLYIGATVPALPSLGECEMYTGRLRQQMYAALQRSNLTIHTIDPRGLEVFFSPDGARRNARRQGQLAELAERTGGRPILNNNRAGDVVPALLDETSSYYILGFQPEAPADLATARSIQVLVDRDDVRVNARASYGGPGVGAPEPLRSNDVTTTELFESVSGLLPVSAIPLSVTAAAFAGPNPAVGSVLVSVGIGPDAAAGPADEPLPMLAAAFDRNGQVMAMQRRAVSMASATGARDAILQLNVEPGSYEIRTAAGTAGRMGSVYTFVDVPDFSRVPLALSGIVLTHRAEGPTGADGAPVPLPVLPTTQRSFDRTEDVEAFVQVHQGGRDAPGTTAVAVSLVDGRNGAAMLDRIQLSPETFATDRAADLHIRLPLDQLESGAYRLVVEATRGSNQAQGEVGFSVR